MKKLIIILFAFSLLLASCETEGGVSVPDTSVENESSEVSDISVPEQSEISEITGRRE